MLNSNYLSSNIFDLHLFFDLTLVRELGQDYRNILVQIKTFASEINCPLVFVQRMRKIFNFFCVFPESPNLVVDNYFNL